MLPDGPYNPQLAEKKILDFWLKNKFYSPEFQSGNNLSTAYRKNKTDKRETFSIILPPPNANGNLHLGHMSGYAYQDLMGRFERMRGKKVLLLPGKDHAGIQTEVVFERELEKQGKTKQSIGRDEFYKLCYEFCMKQAENARKQEQKIGLSADFDRELFTLDPKIVSEVMKAFQLMYEDNLVYRDKRIINWCPRCQSALADIDTEFKDSESPFYYFKYGFLKPEKVAIELKNKYRNQKINWSITKNNASYTKGNFNDLEIIGIGYDTSQSNTTLEGVVIGIEMRLDNKFRLVVQNPTYTDKIFSNLFDVFIKDSKTIAGAHIILFNEYEDDKYYNNGFILGTVRPETKFGDTALAVNPDDERYKDFVGKEFEVMTLNGPAKIKVIADKVVQKDEGTGMLKVTPAHSPEDWDIAQRHKEEAMPEKQVINFDGKLNHLTGKYEGMTVKEARKAMIPDMKTAGMLVHLDENYKNRIRICERCKHPIEPLISYQWFVNTTVLKREGKRLVSEGFTDIMPEGKKKTYMQWMNSKEDWCITRQLWWGYRLPVWYKGKREQYITKLGEVKEKIADKIINSPKDYEGLIYVGLENPNNSNTETWYQDEDVLDTWFSSGQWPFVTLMAKEKDFETFYPTQVMETGWDILLFWVTRMMLLNPYRAKKLRPNLSENNLVPFRNVYLHGLVLDKNGIKMSKSKGNGIDPFEMMQKYGTDALRLSFVKGNSVGQNYRLYEEKIASNRNFCNKIWNASKFILSNTKDSFDTIPTLALESLNLQKEDKEFLNHLSQLVENITKRIENFQFGIATEELYESFWHNFADVYIEKAKPRLYTKDKDGNLINTKPKEKESRLATQWVLLYSLENYLKLLHPFIPFITETIWQVLPKGRSESETIMYSKWPQV